MSTNKRFTMKKRKMIFGLYIFSFFLNCEKVPIVESKAYFSGNTLILELSYQDLPNKNKLERISRIYLSFENNEQIISLINNKELVTLELKESFFKVLFFDIDDCPRILIFDYGKHSTFQVYLNSDKSGNINVRIAKKKL